MNGCNRSLAGAIRGPIILIAVGVLFALQHFTSYDFGRTWPLLLILFGVLKLLERVVDRDGKPGPNTPTGV